MWTSLLVTANDAISTGVAILNVLLTFYFWLKLWEIRPPPEEWLRWLRRLSSMASWSILHAYLLWWWANQPAMRAFTAGAHVDLSEAILHHTLFAVLHSWIGIHLIQHGRDIVVRAVEERAQFDKLGPDGYKQWKAEVRAVAKAWRARHA